MTAVNSLVVGRVEMSTPLAGTFLLEDCDMISSGIKNGDWVEGGMGAFAAVADGVAMVVDPLGSAIGMGIGWLIEHMEPIKGWFNDLTGDAGEVMGFAGTWENIAAQMQSASDELTRVLGDLDSQHGLMVETYRKFQTECAAHAAAAGRLSSAIGTGMRIASTIVQAVHDITRDALSQAIGTAISAAATAAITLGFGAPAAIAQVTARVASLTAKVGKFVTKLLKAIGELMPLLDDAARLFRSLKSAFDELVTSATGYRPAFDAHGRPHAAPEVGRGPDGVATPAGKPDNTPDGDWGTNPKSASTLNDQYLPDGEGKPTFNNADGQRYGDDQWHNTVENLTPEQKQSIIDYTKELDTDKSPGEIDYKDINNALRTGDVSNPKINDAIVNIQKTMEATPTPHDLTVMRGIDLQKQEWFGNRTFDELIGARIEGQGFTSTTLGDELPGWAKLPEVDSVVYLDAPQGTPALYVESLTAIPGEGELLLGKGLDTVITSAAQDSLGKWHIHATLAPR
ncbi:ADP-ribosyltransferase [Demequina aurantiaca]|uniref:ADP-ribosyltransferase n=1 Tax=Demequina aurantiaca TaxID=676200 RepID=UPI003D33BCA0